MKYACLLWGLVLVFAKLSAQEVSGVVTNASGEYLPFVTVAEESRGIGVTTGEGGEYSIDLQGRGGELVYRYIGYEVLRKRIPASNTALHLDVEMAEATYDLGTVEVSASNEDPAYRIMREAAARREQYLLNHNRYEAEVYVKGFIRITDAPDKILGQEIGDMGGLLDSNRAGIVYLSETYSTIYVEQPDKFRENIRASKVSGDPRGYSFNTVAGVDFELYRKTTEFNKTILSPLAENAPQTYRFRLEGSRRDADDRLIYRISVIPRRQEAAAYGGTVFIEDGSFHLIDAQLYLLGGPLNAPGMDTLHISQSYRQRDGRWEVYQRQVRPVLGLLKFKFGGAFTAVYTSYDYSPDWEESPFGAVETYIEPTANQTDSSIWNARPIPLSRAEQLDYFRKDSIRLRVSAPSYKDSVQRESNKFEWDAILGYTYKNWRKRSSFSYTSPLADISYHSVPGYLVGAALGYEKQLDSLDQREFSITGGVRYGFGDERWYPHLETSFRFDRIDRQKLNLKVARELADIHREEPVSFRWNSLASWLFRENPLKLYERDVIQLEHETMLRRPGSRQKLPPWASLRHSIRLEDRRTRENTTFYSVFREGTRLEPNRPPADFSTRGLREEAMLVYEGEISHTPGQRYLIRPDAQIATGSVWPTITLDWRYGTPVSDGSSSSSFLFTGLGVRKDDWRLGRVGLFSFRAKAIAQLLSDPDIALIDQTLFAGNPLQINTIPDYLSRFIALPPYAFATDGYSLETAFEHNFNGAIWSRLPLLNKLRWHVIVRGAVLRNEFDAYEEYGVGIGNIGFGLVRFFRVDIAWNSLGERSEPNYLFGINLPFGDDGVEISF